MSNQPEPLAAIGEYLKSGIHSVTVQPFVTLKVGKK